MHPYGKFVLSLGALSLVGFAVLVVLSLAAAKANISSVVLILADVVGAIIFVLASRVASRRQWFSTEVSMARAVFAALPLTFVPAVLLFPSIVSSGLIERSIFGNSLVAHRVFAPGIVARGSLVVPITLAAIVVAGLVFLSLSFLTKIFNIINLVGLCAGSVLLANCSLFLVPVPPSKDANWMVPVALFVVFLALLAWSIAILWRKDILHCIRQR